MLQDLSLVNLHFIFEKSSADQQEASFLSVGLHQQKNVFKTMYVRTFNYSEKAKTFGEKKNLGFDVTE